MDCQQNCQVCLPKKLQIKFTMLWLMPEMLFVVFDYYVLGIVYCGYCCTCDVFVVVRMCSI
jgi:hypothetical protein